MIQHPPLTTTSQLHPTPQFERANWLDLCGAWEFAFDDQNAGLDEGWECRPEVYDRRIKVPYPPESPLSGIEETGYHPVIWYRRIFFAGQPAPGSRLLLHFGAVDYAATVWVNGQLVGQHRGGNTPFLFDVTRALVPGEGEQVIVVRAEDRPDDLTQPRGKQDWQAKPHVIWYHRTSGIWQPVWMEWVSGQHLEEIRWTPDAAQARLSLYARVARVPAHPLALRVRLSLHGKLLVDDIYSLPGQELEREIKLNDAGMNREELLWSPETPNLIEAELELLDGVEVLDTVSSYAGLRSVGLDNGRFILNGTPYYLRMVLEQGYWHESCLAAPDEEAIRAEVEWIKRLGFNGVRIHQKVEDPRFLYWCDRLGLCVWGEMANAYTYSFAAVERLVSEWSEVVRRDFNHPSIVTWVPVNESWGAPGLESDGRQPEFLKAMYALTRALDSTRPVIENDGWEHVETDIFTIHDYATSGDKIRERYASRESIERLVQRSRPLGHRLLLDGHRVAEDAVVMLTEFGGISYKPQAGTPWFGYGTVTSAEEYLAKLEELIGAVLECRTIAGFCYTQLTDTEQETNGLLTAGRKAKFDADALRKIITMKRNW